MRQINNLDQFEMNQVLKTNALKGCCEMNGEMWCVRVYVYVCADFMFTLY